MGATRIATKMTAVIVAALLGSCSSDQVVIDEPVDVASLGPEVRLEMARVSETFALIAHFSQMAWPGFQVPAESGIAIHFPDGTILALGEHGLDVGHTYHPITASLIGGRPCFVEMAAGQVNPDAIVSFASGHEDGPSNRINVELATVPAEIVAAIQAVRDDPTSEQMISVAKDSTEDAISLYAHEMFHGYQDSVWPERLYGASLRDTHMKITADYAAYSEVEGMALAAALGSKEGEVRSDDALLALADFLAARQAKRLTMSDSEIAREIEISKLEGGADYAGYALLAGAAQSGYLGTADLLEDPLFLQYRSARAIRARLPSELLRIGAFTRNDDKKYYAFGAGELMLLDRFAPEWRTSFTWNGSDPDALLSGLPGMQSLVAEEAAILDDKFDLAALKRKHADEL